MKKPLIYALLLAAAGAAIAQPPPKKTFDGAVIVGTNQPARNVEQGGSAPPLIVASGSKLDPTQWNATDSGVVSIKGVNSGATQSVVVNPRGQASIGASSAGQPATIIRTGATTRTVTYTDTCPAYHSGTITWEQDEIRTVVVNEWKPNGPKKNYVNSCTPIVETRWTPGSQSCPPNYTGSITWEAEERRVGGGAWTSTGRTQNKVDTCKGVVETRWVDASQSCPANYTGSITWQAEEQRVGGGAWTPTGRTQNRVDSCKGSVETRWVNASQSCPANYTGSITWQAEEQRVGGGAWTPTGRTQNRVDGCTGTVETRWIAASTACPAGQVGSNTWEAEEQRVAGGAWTATGRTRNASNTCVPDRNPGTNPPITTGSWEYQDGSWGYGSGPAYDYYQWWTSKGEGWCGNGGQRPPQGAPQSCSKSPLTSSTCTPGDQVTHYVNEGNGGGMEGYEDWICR